MNAEMLRASATPSKACRYAIDNVTKRWRRKKALEPIIMTSAFCAMDYACHVIEGRWPEAEPIIITNPYAALEYAINVIKGRWPIGEPIILTDPARSVLYAEYVIRGRWLDAEPSIMTLEPCRGEHIQRYAKEVMKGRWLEAESNLSKDAEYSYIYAREVIKGRFHEAEPTIKANTRYAYQYARDCIRGRWEDPLVELRILEYGSFSIRGRPSEYALEIAKMSPDSLRAELEIYLADFLPNDNDDLTDTKSE